MLTSQELQDNIQSAAQYRERRHSQWTENYRLYRDTVITNRLTQRRSFAATDELFHRRYKLTGYG